MYQVQVYELKTEDPFVVLAFSVFPTGSWLILASFSLPARRRNRKNNLFFVVFFLSYTPTNAYQVRAYYGNRDKYGHTDTPPRQHRARAEQHSTSRQRFVYTAVGICMISCLVYLYVS